MNHRQSITAALRAPRSQVRSWILCLALLMGAQPGRAADKDPQSAGVPGFDESGMTPSEAGSFHKLLQKYQSRCGKPHSLLTSVRTDPKCKRSLIAAQEMGRLFKNGYTESEVEERYEERFVKRKCHDIDTAGAMVKGDAKAPITIVEFSDFQCPHCKAAEPMLKTLLEQHKDVKLAFMNFPLQIHPNAAEGAAAALAAGKQGKFWAYHDKLFANQDRMGPADLTHYAEELKLDMGRFQADMEGARVRVKRERSIGDKLELDGTPAFYVNGCEVPHDFKTPEGIRAMVEEESGK